MKRSGIDVPLPRLVRLLLAELRCEWYLITKGMWRGESKFCGWHKDDGRLSFIASATGSIFDGTLTVKRVFWSEHGPNNKPQGRGASPRPAGGAGSASLCISSFKSDISFLLNSIRLSSSRFSTDRRASEEVLLAYL